MGTTGFRKQNDCIHRIQNVIMALEDAKLFKKDTHALIVDFTLELNTTGRRVFFYFLGTTRLLFGVDTPEVPPTPLTPLPVPPPDKKGYHSAPFGVLHLSAYSSIPETIMPQSYGTKTEIRTSMHT